MKKLCPDPVQVKVPLYEDHFLSEIAKVYSEGYAESIVYYESHDSVQAIHKNNLQKGQRHKNARQTTIFWAKRVTNKTVS